MFTDMNYSNYVTKVQNKLSFRPKKTKEHDLIFNFSNNYIWTFVTLLHKTKQNLIDFDQNKQQKTILRIKIFGP
jgi:hypothetical protein